MHLAFNGKRLTALLYGLVFALLAVTVVTYDVPSANAQALIPFPTINFTGFTGTGFVPSPTAGQLDSDTWRVQGMNTSANFAFGDSGTTGDFARGASTGGVSTGGVYAFDIGGGNVALGIQPGGSDMTPGTITLRLQNNTGTPITALDVSYTIAANNNEGYGNSFNFAYSSDDLSYTAVSALDFASGTVADALGWQTVPRSTTINGLNIADGAFYYLQWQTDDAGGVSGSSRDELALDNVSVSVPSGPPVDTPPTASFTPDGSVDVPTNSTFVVDFNENVTINASAFANITFTCGVNNIVFGTSTGTNQLTITPSALLPDSTACTLTLPADIVTDQDGTPDNMAANAVLNFTTETPLVITPIHTIQGGGSAVTGPGPFTVEAIVTADYQVGGFKGFYIQEEDADADGDSLTSEGIFVYCGGSCPVVAVGDVVQVKGTAKEYYNLSELDTTVAGSFISVTGSTTLPTAASLTFPLGSEAEFEAVEGMLVTVTNTMHVTEYYNYDRYGTLMLDTVNHRQTFTNANAPDAAGYTAYLNDQLLNRVTLDDGLSTQNPGTYLYPDPAFSITNYFRGGDSVSGVQGVLDYRFGLWSIQPTNPAALTFTASNPRPASAPNVGGNVTVASFNVLNYFNGNGDGTGFPTARGAKTNSDFVRQSNKIVAAMAEIGADVFGLMEIENDGDKGATSAVADLVNRLNGVVGAGTYGFINTGVIGTDEITVAMIYNTDVVTPVAGGLFIDTDPTNNRPTVAQLFEVTDALNPSYGERFLVVVNHFKSKGSACGAGDDDTTTGQGNCNATRVAQATRLVTWLNSTVLPSAAVAGETDVLIIGDLNSYAMEDPITYLTSHGFSDKVAAFAGGSDNTYSYVFNGGYGYLDHALASDSLIPQMTGVQHYHINADEADLLDYSTQYNPAGFYEANEFRSSDHDPVLIGLNLFPVIVGDKVIADDTITLTDTVIVLTETVEKLEVEFSTDMFNNGASDHPDSVLNPANYLLVEAGTDGTFQTATCAAGVAGDDAKVTGFSVAYNPVSFMSTLTFATPLGEGKYQLLLCGTTSLVSEIGRIELNGGADSVILFNIDLPDGGDTGGTGSTISQPEDLGVTQLPQTGEAPAWRTPALVGVLAALAVMAGAVYATLIRQ